MTNVDTHDVAACFQQIKSLEKAGCDIVRLAVPDVEAAKSFCELKKLGVKIPLVADIHFDYKIALASIAAISLFNVALSTYSAVNAYSLSLFFKT